MGVGRVLKSYVWWTHERGSVHYDVMVTLILAFIFLTPRFIHYGDQPKPDWPGNEIRVTADPGGGMVYGVPATMLATGTNPPTSEELGNAIAGVSGPMTVDRWEPVKEVGGRVVAWRVWAHR